MLKFPVPGGIVTLRSSKLIPLECTMVSGPEVQPFASTRVVEKRIKVAIHPEYPEKTIAIGFTLTEEGRKEMCDLLRRNIDIFAWKPADMTRVPRHIAKHRLNVREGCPPFRQSILETNWQKLEGIRGRSGNQEQHGTRNNEGHRRNIQNPKGNKHEAKSQEMHLQGERRHVHGIQEAEWKIGKSKQVLGQVGRKVTTILQNFKEMHKE
ncbi:hypothetical protein Tco_1108379 [Tanacetum coccineum]